MKIVNYKCPNCGANLKVESGITDGVCEYCQSPYHIDDGVIRVEYKVEFKNDNYLEVAQTTLDKFKDYQKSEYLFKLLLNKYGHKKEVYIGIVRSIANDFTISINNLHRLNELNGYFKKYQALATKNEIKEYENKVINLNKLYWYNLLVDSTNNFDIETSKGDAKDIEIYWRHYIKYATLEEHNNLKLKYSEFIECKKSKELENKKKIKVLIVFASILIISIFLIDFMLLYTEKVKLKENKIEISKIIDSINTKKYEKLTFLLKETRSDIVIKNAVLNSKTKKLEITTILKNKYNEKEEILTLDLVDDFGPVITSNNCTFKDTDIIDVNKCFTVFDYTDGEIPLEDVKIEYEKENLNKEGTKTIKVTAEDKNGNANTQNIEFVVTKTPITIDLNLSNTLYVGETAKINYSINPTNIPNKNVEFIFDKEYVNVDSNGNIRGIKKGTTEVCIVSKYNNSKKCINVNVELKCLDSYTFNFSGADEVRIVAGENFCPGTYQVFSNVLNHDQVYYLTYSANGLKFSEHITICKFSDFLSKEGSRYAFNEKAYLEAPPGITSIKLIKVY